MSSRTQDERIPSANKLRRAGWYAAFGIIPFGTSIPGLLIILVDRILALFTKGTKSPSLHSVLPSVRWAKGLMLALLASVMLSSVLSPRPGVAFLRDIGFFLAIFSLFFGALELGREAPEDLHRSYLPVLLLAGVAACVVALIRYAAAPGGIHEQGNRAVNLFTRCNGLGTNLIFLGGLGLTYAVSSGGKWKQFSLLFFGLVCLTLLATKSRGAWFGFAGMIGVLSLFNRKYLAALLATVLLLGLLFCISPALMNRLEQAFSLDANLNRLYIWQSTLKIISDHPIVGVGTGVFPFIFKDYMMEGATESSPPFAHNIFLQVFAEFGAIGLSIFTAFLGLVIFMSFRLARTGQPIYQGIFAVIVGILIHQQVDCTIWGLDVGGSFWMLLGLVVGLYAHTYAGPSRAWQAPKKVLAKALD